MNLNNLTIFNLASEKFCQCAEGEFMEKFRLSIPSAVILISLSRHDIQIYDFPSPASSERIFFFDENSEIS